MPKSASKKDARKANRALVRVSVHLPNGSHYEKNADVVLIAGRDRYPLKRLKGASLYEGNVDAGEYRLVVKAGDLVAPERPVVVPKTGKTASAYLGKPDWPVYRFGENVIPFEPLRELLAVAFSSRVPSSRLATATINEIVKKLKIKPYEHASDREAHPAMAGEGSIWLFEIPPADRDKITSALRRMLPEHARIGMPLDVTPKRVKVLDGRFIVRFRDFLRPQDINALVERAKARIIRSEFLQAGNARLIEFMSGTFRDHLRAIEDWYKKELLVYGEPDLVIELVDDVFPADPPSDPTYGNQLNLTLQNVDNAWQFLNGIDANITVGSPDVFVATLDRGVDIDHPDIGGNLTDGTPQLQCYDFRGLQACSAPGYAPDTSHGMGVFGIISALTNNAEDVAGIASNVHHIGLKRATAVDTTDYADVLLWAAGFTTGNATAGWPAEPITPGADIISCSHGQDGLALSGFMDDTLTFLSVYGRGGKGTFMIYSAGNSGNLITGFRVWAAHPRTMAIANSDQPDAMGIERRHDQPGVDTSNFGPEIDICAQGHGAPSLNHIGGEQNFGGTSAAAPTVAAAAALMLSAEPNLTWINLRDILRDTAVVIDGANADPVGQWVGGFSQWYGFGRLDVEAAVEAADAFDPGSINLVIRDNLADTGAFVPSGGTFWRSPDLWVRRDDPATDPIGDPAYNVDPPNEAADSGEDNWIRVRVKNTGSAASGNFFVRVYLTHFAGSQFVYPASYIPSGNPGDPIPAPLVQGTYEIGEQMVASLGIGGELILNFLWPENLVPPEFVDGTAWHPCILAEVSPHTPPAASGTLVVDNKNLAQRNVSVDYSDDDGSDHEATGVIGNEEDDSRVKRIVVNRGHLPKKSRVWVRFLDRKVERAVVKLLGDKGSEQDRGDQGPCCCLREGLSSAKSSGVRVTMVNGRRRFEVVGSDLVLDIPMVGGALTPVVVGAQIPKGELRRSFEIPLIEQSTNGKTLGAFALEVAPK